MTETTKMTELEINDRLNLISDCVITREKLIQITATDDDNNFAPFTGVELTRMDNEFLNNQIFIDNQLIAKFTTKNSTGYDLKGRTCTIKIGDKVRAWDFEPMPGREDCYVEGTFTGYSEDGRLKIENIFTDTLHGNRTAIYTPPFGQVIFGEWNGRITKL